VSGIWHGAIRRGSRLAGIVALAVPALLFHALAQARTDPAVRNASLALAQVSNSERAGRSPSALAGCPGRSECAAAASAAVEARQTAHRAKISPTARHALLLLTAFWLFCGIALWIGSRDAVVAMAVVGGPALMLGLGRASNLASGVATSGTGTDSSGAMGLLATAVLLVGGSAIVARGMAWVYEGLFGEPGWLRRGYRSWREPMG